MSDYPFREKHIKENIFLREFKETTGSEELVWHQDQEDRAIFVIEGNGWQLQMDNELPVLLEKGKEYFIPAYKFHRVIKGNGSLEILLEKRK